MAEAFYFSNKTRNENIKYLFVFLFAVITWILQVSIFSRLTYFDSTSNLMFLGSILVGLIMGPLYGTIFGLISSFFSSSLLYDHVFYFSYPLIGFTSGLLMKNIFSEEIFFFILLSFFLTFPFELINLWQYDTIHNVKLFDRFLMISFNCSILNLLLSPIMYFTVKSIIKKLIK